MTPLERFAAALQPQIDRLNGIEAKPIGEHVADHERDGGARVGQAIGGWSPRVPQPGGADDHGPEGEPRPVSGG